MAAKSNSKSRAISSIAHFAEPTSITTTFDVDSVSGRFIQTDLDVTWTDKEGHERLRTITSISKDYAWRRARKFAQRLADQGLKPVISNSPERPLMMQLVDMETGNISYKLRRYSIVEAAAIIRRLANSTKTPVFVIA